MTDKKDKALKLALEALEIGEGHPVPWWVQEKQGKAITAIREALASEASEQPAQQQEPVAWYESMAELAAVYGEMCAINETPSKDQTAEQKDRLRALRAECVAVHYRRITMNTSPPASKPWVGLTDEFAKWYWKACESSQPDDWLMAALAAQQVLETSKPEAKLRERNEHREKNNG